jgi:putative oxidoreductase
MATETMPMTSSTASGPARGAGPIGRVAGLVERVIVMMGAIPHWLIAALARFSIAAVFWKSGQTKIEGFALDLVGGMATIGIPKLSENAVTLFKEEYKLPLIGPETGALLAATAEHVLAALILIGLATRFSALGLLVMTAVIEIFVYPDAYPTHGVWAAVLLYLMARGPGAVSFDHLIAKQVRGA